MSDSPIQLSICIVSFQARDYLQECLTSLVRETQKITKEIIVVDNGSTDGTSEMLGNYFPQVRLIRNAENTGFTAPMNQALRAASGKFLVQLNPDTVILPGAFQSLLQFMEQNFKVGICGPKVLNRDGSFQIPCRRGEPRPLAVMGYFFKLGNLFPKSKRLNEYLLSYLDENETQSVPAVSGSCMLIRREVVDRIGYLDESFFAYQEDSDFCHRARQAGWDVVYFPEAKIIHFGGHGGSRVQPFRSLFAWHYSYWLYYRKHLAKDHVFLLNWIYYLLILGKFTMALSKNMLSREKIPATRRP